jgi:hypothetical protein
MELRERAMGRWGGRDECVRDVGEMLTSEKKSSFALMSAKALAEPDSLRHVLAFILIVLVMKRYSSILTAASPYFAHPGT